MELCARRERWLAVVLPRLYLTVEKSSVFTENPLAASLHSLCKTRLKTFSPKV